MGRFTTKWESTGVSKSLFHIFEGQLTLHIEGEKYLFALKEILISEQGTQVEFILQIFWGLLCCEILLQREKTTIEKTTLNKIKEFIEKLISDQTHTHQENMSHRAWLIHQILVYSFTNNCPDFFGDLLSKPSLGQSFLNIVQIKCQYLLRYMIASLLINKDYDSLLEIVAPITQQERNRYSDPFTQFIDALYEDFDFKKAQELIKEISAVAEDDLLLKPFASQIQLQATILLQLVQSQIYKTVDIR